MCVCVCCVYGDGGFEGRERQRQRLAGRAAGRGGGPGGGRRVALAGLLGDNRLLRESEFDCCSGPYHFMVLALTGLLVTTVAGTERGR